MEINGLILAVKQIAQECGLQNSEQISEENSAIGAVRMIASEYADLRQKYYAARLAPFRAQQLAVDLWWFIENVNDQTPDRTERFFALRERFRDTIL